MSRAILIIVLGATWSCTAPGPSRTDSRAVPTTRDSSGIRLTEYSADAFAEAPRVALDTMAITVITSKQGDPAFDLNRTGNDVTVLSDGRVAVFPDFANSLMIFRPDGKPDHIYGGGRDGPGRFGGIPGMYQIAGDTLYIPDYANNRANWVLADRGVVRQAPLTTKGEFFCQRLAGLLPTGSVVMFSPCRPFVPGDTATRQSIHVVLSGQDGSGFRQIAEVPAYEYVPMTTHSNGRTQQRTVLPRFSAVPKIAAWDSFIAIAGIHGYEITIIDSTGRMVRQLRVPVSRRPVTEAMRVARIARELANVGVGEGTISEEYKQQVREMPSADSLPLIGRLFSTADKLLWVADYRELTDTAWTATAFRLDGTIAMRLHVFGRSDPVYFGVGRVMVRTIDDHGVVSLRLYHLVPVPKS